MVSRHWWWCDSGWSASALEGTIYFSVRWSLILEVEEMEEGFDQPG